MDPFEYLHKECMTKLQAGGYTEEKAKGIADYCVKSYRIGLFRNAWDVTKYLNKVIKHLKAKEARAANDPLKRRP